MGFHITGDSNEGNARPVTGGRPMIDTESTPFDSMPLEDAYALARAFAVSHSLSEVHSVCRYVRRTTGSDIGAYIYGCHFTEHGYDFDTMYPSREEYLHARQNAWTFLEAREEGSDDTK